MIDPQTLCRKHLLGEHFECHMIAMSILYRHSLDGYVQNGLIEPTALTQRHSALATEINARGYNHISALPDITNALQRAPLSVRNAKIDQHKALLDLHERCASCRRKYYKKYKKL